ncbi:MAG: hypothetical protein ABUL62_07760 [Myxococcales bacterium]
MTGLARRALLAVVVTCLLLLSTARASAQKVVLVVPPAPDEVLSEAFNRLRAELTLQGFETTTVELDAVENTPDKLSELARNADAFAGISLVQRVGTPTAEVCIADRVTGKTTLRTLALDKKRDAPSVLAVRTTDLLRASLREFAGSERPPPEVVNVDSRPPAPVVERFASTAPRRFRLDARAAALGFTHRIGPGFGPSLGLSYRLGQRFSAGLLAVGPAVGASFDTSLGSAAVRQELGLVHVAWSFVQTERVELRATAGAGVYRLDANGVVGPPLSPVSGHVTGFAGGVGVEADLRLSAALLVGAELSGFALGPRPGIAVASERYLYRAPFLSLSLGIGVEF